jgi:hypothetical protein
VPPSRWLVAAAAGLNGSGTARIRPPASPPSSTPSSPGGCSPPPEQQATAAWFPGEAYLLTEPLIARLVADLTRRGGTLLTGEPGRVTGLDAGPVDTARVRTAAGAEIEADQVLCCAGRWTPALAALAGAAGTVPLVPWDTPGSPAPELVVRAGPVTGPGPARVIHTPRIALRPHPGGLLHLEAPTGRRTCTPPRPNCAGWPPSSSTGPGRRSAAWTRRTW